jgi:hypothetical protein
MNPLFRLLSAGLLLTVPAWFFLQSLSPYGGFDGGDSDAYLPEPPLPPYVTNDEEEENSPFGDPIEIVGIDPEYSGPDSLEDGQFQFVLVLSEEPSEAWTEKLSDLASTMPEFESLSFSGDAISLVCPVDQFTNSLFPALKDLAERCNAALVTDEIQRRETIEAVARQLDLPTDVPATLPVSPGPDSLEQ